MYEVSRDLLERNGLAAKEALIPRIRRTGGLLRQRPSARVELHQVVINIDSVRETLRRRRFRWATRDAVEAGEAIG